MLSDSAFTFQASARPIEQRPKYRGEQYGPRQPCMITVDPRVYRGSTYSKHRQGQQEDKNTKTRRKPPSPRSRETDAAALAPGPKRENRIDIGIQTEAYLQEILEKAAELEKSTQTDTFLDRPPTPPYFPPRTGVDVETQIEDNDLFEFFFEVQPIVSTVVTKTLEQAFFEVHEEAELANIRRHKEALEHRRNLVLADVQRLEEAERRKFEERQKRMKQRLDFENAQRELRYRLSAAGFGEFFAADLMGDVISLLERRGYFYDEVEREIGDLFLPWMSMAMEEANDVHGLKVAIGKAIVSETILFDAKLKTSNADAIETKEIRVRNTKLGKLRQQLVEDLGAAKIRTALKGKKRPRKATEEEDSAGNRSED
jgi:hypothetical protein